MSEFPTQHCETSDLAFNAREVVAKSDMVPSSIRMLAPLGFALLFGCRAEQEQWVALSTCANQVDVLGARDSSGSPDSTTMDGLTTAAEKLTVRQTVFLSTEANGYDYIEYTLFKGMPSEWEYSVAGEVLTTGSDENFSDGSSFLVEVEWDTASLAAGTYEHSVRISNGGGDELVCSYDISVADTLMLSGIEVDVSSVDDEVLSAGLDLYVTVHAADTSQWVATAWLPEKVNDSDYIPMSVPVYEQATGEPVVLDWLGEGPWYVSVYDQDSLFSGDDWLGSSSSLTTSEMLASSLQFEPIDQLDLARGRSGEDLWEVVAHD